MKEFIRKYGTIILWASFLSILPIFFLAQSGILPWFVLIISIPLVVLAILIPIAFVWETWPYLIFVSIILSLVYWSSELLPDFVNYFLFFLVGFFIYENSKKDNK